MVHSSQMQLPHFKFKSGRSGKMVLFGDELVKIHQLSDMSFIIRLSNALQCEAADWLNFFLCFQSELI